MAELKISMAEVDPVLMARFDRLAAMRALAAKKQWKAAAKHLAETLVEDVAFEDDKDAESYIRDYFYRLLNEDRYAEAGAVAWLQGMFNPKPLHVQRIFKALTEHDQVILVGGGDLGKSNNTAAWLALDLIRDPEDTTAKFASVNAENLKSNLWSRISNYITNSLFHPGFQIDQPKMKIWIDGARPDTGASAVFLGRDTGSRGALKGLHPQQFRPEPHAVWGNLTRVRIMLDEGQQLTEGVLEDISSPMTSVKKDGKHLMKIVITCNPTDEQKWVIREAAPRGGWMEKYLDTHYDWDSETGWHVCRLDAAKTENCIERREVYEGFPTIDTEKRFLNGTILTARWYTFFRGFPPPGRANDVVVPTSWYDQAIGEPIFTGAVENVAAFDPAYERDTAVLAIGRYGEASGWLDWEGGHHEFDSRKVTGEKERRHCAVIDQLIYLEAHDPASCAVEVRVWCDKLRIRPEMVAGDSTGSGIGTTSHLRRYWGDILAINWTAKATEIKILAEDKEGASYQATNVISEMAYTLRRWIEPRVRGLFINPTCDHRDKLKHQATSRQFAWEKMNAGFNVETKHKYTARGNESPGEFDAVLMALFVIRQRGLKLPALVDEQVIEVERRRIHKDAPRDEISDQAPLWKGEWQQGLVGAPVAIPERFDRRLQ